MPHRDEVLEAEGDPERHGEEDDHREAGVDGAGDEVGGKDRRVPARDDADREVPAHDRVDGEDERRAEAGEKEARRLVVVPVPRRAAPAHREDAVRPSARRSSLARSRSVARSGISPMNQKSAEIGRVGRDGEDVPDERAPEVAATSPIVFG